MSNKTLGKYQIIQKLGDGLTCKVYLAFDTEEKEKVAVKIIKENLPAAVQQSIKTEVQAMGFLDHPHIVKLK